MITFTPKNPLATDFYDLLKKYTPDNTSGAVLSACQTYRYRLWRRWAPGGTTVLWVMLNPSTADETKPDPTLNKCIGFSQRWGHSALEIVNLFAYRTPEPKVLKQAIKAGIDVVGPDNERHLISAIESAQRVIVAWGANGSLPARDKTVTDLICAVRLAKPEAVRITKNGAPEHPLYIPYDAQPVPYPPEKNAP